MAYGIFRAVSQPKLYEAYGRIQVRSGSSNEYRVSAVEGYSADASSKMLTEVAILRKRFVDAHGGPRHGPGE